MNTYNLINVKNFIKKLFIYDEDKYILKKYLEVDDNLPNIVLLINNFMDINVLTELNQNIIQIKSYFGNNNDDELFFIKPLLKNLSGYYDVREEIKKFVHLFLIDKPKVYKWMVDANLNNKFLEEFSEIVNKNEEYDKLPGIANAKKTIIPFNKIDSKCKYKEVEKLKHNNFTNEKIKKINPKYNDGNNTYVKSTKNNNKKPNNSSFILRNYSRFQNNSVKNYLFNDGNNKFDNSIHCYIGSNYMINNSKIKSQLRNSASYKIQNRIMRNLKENIFSINKKENTNKNSKLNIIINNDNNSSSSLQKTIDDYKGEKTNLFNNININKFISIKENPAFIINLDFVQKYNKIERSRSAGKMMNYDRFKCPKSNQKRKKPIFGNYNTNTMFDKRHLEIGSPKFKKKYVFNFK